MFEITAFLWFTLTHSMIANDELEPQTERQFRSSNARRRYENSSHLHTRHIFSDSILCYGWLSNDDATSHWLIHGRRRKRTCWINEPVRNTTNRQ